MEASEQSVGQYRREDEVVLVVEDQKIPVSKTVLSIASPVFKTMFESEFAEKDKKEIPLPDKSYVDVKEFLACIYPDTLQKVTDRNVYRLLPLTHEYQTSVLVSTCERKLIKLVQRVNAAQFYNHNRYNTAYEVFRNLQYSVKYGLEELRKVCINIISDLRLCERDTEIHQIPESLHPEISRRAIEKLEIHLCDEYDMNVANSKTREDYIKGKINAQRASEYRPGKGFIYTESEEDAFVRKLKGVRLAYRHYQKDLSLKQTALECLEKNEEFHCHDKFDLLPEIIKQELKSYERKCLVCKMSHTICKCMKIVA